MENQKRSPKRTNNHSKSRIRFAISFCVITLGLLEVLLVCILKPSRTTSVSSPNHKNDPISFSVDFPFVQEDTVETNDVAFIDYYLEDDSINKYEYDISLTINGKEEFFHHYSDYSSNIVRIPSELQKGDIIKITINCEQCKKVQFGSKTNSGENRLTVDYYSKPINYGYISYGILAIVAGIILWLLIKEDNNEEAD